MQKAEPTRAAGMGSDSAPDQTPADLTPSNPDALQASAGPVDQLPAGSLPAPVARPFLSPFTPNELDTIAVALTNAARHMQQLAADAPGIPYHVQRARKAYAAQLFTLAQRAETAARASR
jgi:hypothetical protein